MSPGITRYSKLLFPGKIMTRLTRRIQTSCCGAVEVIFPPKCGICGSLFDPANGPGEKTEPHTINGICGPCKEGVTPAKSPMCTKCGLVFTSSAGSDHLCSDCILGKNCFRRARAFGVYDGSLMKAIHNFKYGKKLSLAQPLSAMTGEAFFRTWAPAEIDLIIPVPLHISRLRSRGFNQAYLLMNNWTKETTAKRNCFILSRAKATPPQASLTREQRQHNISKAFEVTSSEQITGKRILLIDDVLTTGATINECARILMQHGAQFVDALTLARAL